MRPRGEERQALAKAAADALAAGCKGATWRDLAERARVGYQAARRAAENMRRAGDLEAVGTVTCAHSRRPMMLLAPRSAPPEPAALQCLADAMRGWAAER